jgi:membrane fusion protein, multidrug efflux system
MPKRFVPLMPGRSILTVGGAVALACAGAVYIVTPRSSVSTDDAYLKTENTTVAPKVRGLVAEILVQENQKVRAGDRLVRINSEEFDARVGRASADLQSANAAVDAARATLSSLDAEERLAEANVRAAETLIQSADAQSTKAVADQGRYDRLRLTGTASQRDADQYRATAISARSEADRSRAALEVTRNQAGMTRAKRPILRAQLAQAEAAVVGAKAALDLALQDQRHALIVAPVDGVVGNLQVRTGDYVQPGSRLLTLVPLHAIYAVGNFKETQTARMAQGQATVIEVDALPGVLFRGKVESFAPGSGSEFALLPFEPGTGNFTKIVQRVPVRIRFEPDQPELARLRPGLSATVTVMLNQKRQ